MVGGCVRCLQRVRCEQRALRMVRQERRVVRAVSSSIGSGNAAWFSGAGVSAQRVCGVSQRVI